MPRFSWLHTATLTLGLAANTAQANTDTGTLGVAAQVQDVCSVEGGTLDFGVYSGGQASDLEATGSIRYVNCSAGDLSFSLDGGQSSDEAARTLSDGNGATLGYQLFRNPNLTQIWGTGTNALVWRLVVSGSGEVPVYGLIPGGQDIPAGSYADAVNITLTF